FHRPQGQVGGQEADQALDHQQPPESRQDAPGPRPGPVPGDHGRPGHQAEAAVGEGPRPAVAGQQAVHLDPNVGLYDARGADGQRRDCDEPLDGAIHLDAPPPSEDSAAQPRAALTRFDRPGYTSASVSGRGRRPSTSVTPYSSATAAATRMAPLRLDTFGS